ncbi:hypothetical protein Y1Q_0000125 [Alligator mississippiensis]|uniref:Uncharacterized protein n=1 Tax=Alligator mississippiensis TaxID=8496 RepID=A0A151NQZ3_ALLMI|nr:hypothetical protein Y1Q_0000125 [Alligator mississippiensis]
MAPQADVKHIFIFAVSLRPTNKYSLPDDAALILNRIQDCSCKRKSISLFQLMSCIFLGDLPSMYWRSCQMSVGICLQLIDQGAEMSGSGVQEFCVTTIVKNFSKS